MLTNAIEHDLGQLEVLVDDKESMYVFDRGNFDYDRIDRMTDDGYFFVSCLRKNAVTRVMETLELPEDSLVLSDEIIVIGMTQNRAEIAFRLLKVIDSKGNELQLLTNRFDLDEEELAELYKSRWAIELFFKWMKQHLNIKKFYGHSEQAVHNQVYIAMIVYCSNVLAQLRTNSSHTYLEIGRFLKVSWRNSAKGYSEKMDVHYHCLRVFVFF